ncbi:P1 family peptidase [Skermanella rosea]|uniref:DmpA family aminopeptidase n=1 Tax=Skermanella rosea TaxID=1817965 RepID=UPI0019341A31|nr:P1 family peptidase [Skermanella rosea]UEM02479.1 P1 family peptidase [Skermanella rosea]
MTGTVRLARDYGLACGTLPAGALNAITDVPGVRVGHLTRTDGDLRTGVTAVLPHGGNLYRDKVPAAADVINGFGKSAGLIQVEELGSVETPILLTNTFAVGTGFNALVRHAIRGNPDIGRETATVNPVVCECNDGYLSDIQAMALTEADTLEAVAAALEGPVAQGSVGAGTGMSAFGFKGGIGTASRRLALDGEGFHLGVLALANFGRAGDLVLPDGRRPVPPDVRGPRGERGSVILLMATDIPLESRQLRRVARRGGAGLARLGAYWGHGSGDIALAFTTARRIRHDQARDIVETACLNENRIDRLFRAAAEATQEAVLNALCASPAMTGRDGHGRPSLADWLSEREPS